MAYNEIRTINNIQLEDIKARQSIQELDNKKANKSDIVSGLNFKGTTTYSALLTSNNSVGDFYYVTDGDGTNGEGNYAWNGTAWYFSGKTTDFGDISTKANAAVNNAAFEEGKLKVTKNDGSSTETEVVDSSLTKSGKAADAAKVGEAINAETTRAKAAEEENAKGVSQLKKAIGDIESSTFIYTKTNEFTEVKGKVVTGEIGESIKETDNQAFRYMKIDVSYMRKIMVGYFSEGWQYDAFFATSENTVIDRKLYRTFDDPKEQKEVELTIPLGSKFLYINSSIYGELYTKTYVYKKSNWTGKKCVCLGDSITEQGTWIEYLKNALGFSDVINRGIGGSTVGYTYENAFWQDKRVNSVDLDADCIIIMGGTNDAGSGVPVSSIVSKDIHNKESFVGGYNILLSKIFYKFYKLNVGEYSDIDYSGVTQVNTPKDIVVMLVSPTFTNSALYIGSETENRLIPIVNAVPKIAEFWNIPYCENYYKTGINDQNYKMYLKEEVYEGNTIFVHPNDNGGKKIGSRIANCLKLYEPIN